MPEWDAIRPFTEWESANPASFAPNLYTLLPDGSVTDAKLAPGISPLKIQGIGCKVYRSTNQTGIVTATETSITFDTTVFDEGDFAVDSGTFTTLTIPQTGVYILEANIEWESNSTGGRSVWLYLNSAKVEGDTRPAQAQTRASAPAVRFMTKGDTVGVRVTQSSGVNLYVAGGQDNCSLTAVFLFAI